jgi:hypothetical protein
MTQFPFDQQTCKLVLSSWSYDIDKMDLVFYKDENYDFSLYSLSSEWELVSTTADRILKVYDKYTYPQLIYHITVRRLSGFYIYVLIAPSLLLSFLTPVLFWIPPSPERTNLGRYSARSLSAQCEALVVGSIMRSVLSCLFVWAPSCVRKSQAISTELGMHWRLRTLNVRSSSCVLQIRY